MTYATLKHLFQHMAWADNEIISALEKTSEDKEDALKLLAHIIAAEHIWLSRILSQNLGDFTPWKKLTLQECKGLAETNREGYFTLAAPTTDLQLNNLITYKTTKGDEYHSRLGDILLHVALHGAYHRGQIASLLRSCQLPPPPTDFILFSRNVLPGLH